jgi:5-methyltetrahydropteroyltriglutamate--homocysteine methyltransferase
VKISTNRILTTHTGSLPRPNDLVELIKQNEVGQITDRAAYEARIRSSVDEIVQHQAQVGIDIVNDGEAGKPGYSTYVKDRLTGFGGESRTTNINAEARDFPEWGVRRVVGSAAIQRPACNGPVAWQDFDAVQREIDNLKAAAAKAKVEEVFMSAASPGVIAAFLPNEHYGTYEEYIQVLADVMRREYEAIVGAGFVLQLDCPDLAMERTRFFQDESLDGFLAAVALHIDAINEAIATIPRDRVRLHLCWGNYDGPHTHDVPLEPLLPILYRAKVGALSLPLASPRHQHELKAFRQHPLPNDMLFLPGVIDSTTNVVEHPEVVADRITAAVAAVGDRTRVLASVDCGFGTFAGSMLVEESVVWTKLRTLREGADLASKRLWG